jgi:hypothetical protein
LLHFGVACSTRIAVSGPPDGTVFTTGPTVTARQARTLTPMNKHVIVDAAGRRIVLVDSITEVDASDAGAIVVSGSHGGSSSARYALAVPLALVVFNDAGVGKDGAGIVALDQLQARGIAAVTVAHTSARIGEAADAWAHGIVSHANVAARSLGLEPGNRLQNDL